MSLAIAKNIFLRFSACASVLLLNWIPPNLVTPSTSTLTSNPKFPSISERSIPVSSTTSCKRPAAITDELAPISFSRSATAMG